MTMMGEEAYIDSPYGLQAYLTGDLRIPGMRVRRNKVGGLNMTVTMAGQVGPSNPTDGTIDQPFRQGRTGEQVVTELHGKYYEQASRGRGFFGSSASGGIALIVPATGGGHPTLWNPLGSGVNVSILRLELGYVSGNNAPTCLEWAVTRSTGSTVATGAPIATATLVNPEPCLIGAGAVAQAKWSPTTNTFTAAPVFLRSAGLSLFTGVAATATIPFPLVANYDGDFTLAPGSAISLCSQASTTTAVFQVTVTWEEVLI